MEIHKNSAVSKIERKKGKKDEKKFVCLFVYFGLKWIYKKK